MGERVPQSVQNLLLRDYCKRKKYDFHLSSVEYCIENSFIHLNNLVNNLKKYDGIIAYSLSYEGIFNWCIRLNRMAIISIFKKKKSNNRYVS